MSHKTSNPQSNAQKKGELSIRDSWLLTDIGVKSEEEIASISSEDIRRELEKCKKEVTRQIRDTPKGQIPFVGQARRVQKERTEACKNRKLAKPGLRKLIKSVLPDADDKEIDRYVSTPGLTTTH